MILDRLFQKSGIQILKKSLDASTLRHKAISTNIANIGTPGYRRKDVMFEEKLQESLMDSHKKVRITNSRHIPIGNAKIENIQPKVVEDPSTEFASGVNNVDIDQEMAELAKNQIQFSATATLIARRVKGLRAAIKGHA